MVGRWRRRCSCSFKKIEAAVSECDMCEHYMSRLHSRDCKTSISAEEQKRTFQSGVKNKSLLTKECVSEGNWNGSNSKRTCSQTSAGIPASCGARLHVTGVNMKVLLRLNSDSIIYCFYAAGGWREHDTPVNLERLLAPTSRSSTRPLIFVNSDYFWW